MAEFVLVSIKWANSFEHIASEVVTVMLIASVIVIGVFSFRGGPLNVNSKGAQL
ncbi:hypothetical protein [uncultured Erythrobacter sp.]|uniref:hypothetical protein n=1 Tax=uncultured Erythrobacter sp. TaxID=263913 RepID=UPI0026233460|nr:hypothetical protein [uncultured Erythrobacter sp.]